MCMTFWSDSVMRVISSPSAKRKRAKEAHPSVSALRRSSTKTIAVSRSLADRVLVVDIGGSSVKILATGQTQSRSFRSGPTLTPARMVEGVRKSAADWAYGVVSIGYPGPVLAGRPIAEPHNLGRGWVGFDFARAFGCPGVKVVNDAAMQALGSYGRTIPLSDISQAFNPPIAVC
jgi:polyphosphate glucokinase